MPIPKSPRMAGLTANPLDGRIASSRHSSPDWFIPFQPLPWLRGGHAQTLAGNYWRRKPFALPVEPEAIEVDPLDGSRVLCHCHWQLEPVRAVRLTILLVHGLEGSSDSQYVRGITALAWNAGCNVIRMNMRNCGGTDTWSPTLYHSGLSADVATVLHHFVKKHGLKRVAMAGYSMGGNLVLKLAGELADQAPKWLLAAVGVSPAVDLAASADALHNPSNRMYEWHFLKNLKRRFRRKTELFPAIYSIDGTASIRTIREFDHRITARYSGFTGADDYYYRAASARVVSRIAIPTLVIHAIDDPFIRMTPASREALAANPAVALVETQHGGHCAFLTKTIGTPKPDFQFVPQDCRHWAEATLVRFLMATAGHADGG
jgi:predicted alpha/beta-fold hydrolase